MNKGLSFLGRIFGLLISMIVLVFPAGLDKPVLPKPRPASPAWQEIPFTGGSIRTIVAYSPKVLYLGTNEGVFHWVKNQWESASAGLKSLFISSLVVDPQNPLILFASTSEDRGVYKSVDGGASWSQAAEGLSGEVRSLAINPKSGSIVYAQTASQVFRTDDGGITWQLKSAGILTGDDQADLLSLRIARSDPSVLYISEIHGSLYKTSDSGDTWTKTSPLLGRRAWVLEIDPVRANTVYAGVSGDGMIMTVDGGHTWVKRNQGMPDDGYAQPLNAILIDPHKTNILYASMNGGGLYRTTDAGLHWNLLTSVGQYSTPLALAADPTAASTIYAGYDGSGLFKSSNGGKTWAKMNAGLTSLSIRSMAPDPKNTNGFYIGSASAGLWNTKNGGGSWNSLNDGLEFADISAIAVDPKDNHNLYVGTDGGGFYRSQDAGRSWNREYIGDGIGEIYALAVNPHSPNIVYLGAFDYGVFKSTDFGQTWQPTGLQGTSAVALAVDPLNPDTVYAGADGVWKSTDGGAHFDPMNAGLENMCVFRLAVDTHTPSTVYAVTCDDGLYKSTEGGMQWDSITIGDSSPNWVSAFALDPASPNILYASLDHHLYRSMDAGGTWSLFEEGLPEGWQVDQLEVSPQKGCVFAAGFYTAGLYSVCP